MGWIIKNGDQGTAVVDGVRSNTRVLELRPFNSKTKRSSAVVDLKAVLVILYMDIHRLFCLT